jgi:transcriptional regulator with XRE-family HTH domain
LTYRFFLHRVITGDEDHSKGGENLMYTSSFQQVGNNISDIMEDRGMTQQYLADQLGVSKQVMSKIINGKKAINIAELSKIASILGVTADMLLSVKNNSQEHKFTPVFMGTNYNDKALRSMDLLKNAIDQIHLLEGLLDE